MNKHRRLDTVLKCMFSYWFKVDGVLQLELTWLLGHFLSLPIEFALCIALHTNCLLFRKSQDVRELVCLCQKQSCGSEYTMCVLCVASVYIYV